MMLPPSSSVIPARRRGNVLVLVVVVLGLLALLGGAYLQTARVQRQMFFDSENCSLLARTFVIEDIERTLKDDIFDPETGNFFDFTIGGRTETYDRAWTNGNATYPVFDTLGQPIGTARGNDKDDTWLASTLPFLDGDTWRWRQISTLNGTWFETDGADVADRRIRPDRGGGANPDNWYGDGPALRNGTDYNIAAFNLGSDLVDADADGVPDSRLERIDSFATKNGVEYFAAVRIIDLASFININTAATALDNNGDFDTAAPFTDAPRGLNPAELNLALVAASVTDPAGADLGSPAGVLSEVKNAIDWRGAENESFTEREELWEGAGRRLGNLDNPLPPAAPDFNAYGDLDELELRFRGGAVDYTERATDIDTLDPDGVGVGDPGPGLTGLLDQGLFAGGMDIIDDDASASRFFPYDPANATGSAPGTRIRMTTASAEALFATPLPIEFGQVAGPDRDVLDGRILKTALNDDRFDLIFRYPSPDSSAMSLGFTLGADDAFGPGADSETGTGTVPDRPSGRIEDMAEALTELAFLVKKVYNSSLPTDKASPDNRPFMGQDPVAAPTPAGGNAQTAFLMGLQPATDEGRVNQFAAQFAAVLKDYVDSDNVITVLDSDGIPLPDRGSDVVRMYPLNNAWTDPDTIAPGESAPPTTVAPNGNTERYGFELFPYVSEVYVQSDYTVTAAVTPSANDNGVTTPEFDVTWERPAGEAVGYAIEIRNPFQQEISLSNIHLFVGATPMDAGTPLFGPVDEWTTSHPDLGIAEADRDADLDGDDLPDSTSTDHDLADLVTHFLQESGALSDDERKDTLGPNEVLVLYRNAGPADAPTENDQIVATDRFSSPLGSDTDGDGPGIREAASQQWEAAVPAGSMPPDSAIDDRGPGRYTYVEVPFDWPTQAGGAGLLDEYPSDPTDTVTVELYAAVADDRQGFNDGVTGGTDAGTAVVPRRFDRLRYQVVNTSQQVVDTFASTMFDMPGAPTVGTRVTMQHSTVGNANGINSIVMRRTDFEQRHVYPNEFDLAQNPMDDEDVNDPLAGLVGDGGGVALTVTRQDVFEEFEMNSSGELQQLLGVQDKTGAEGFPSPGANVDKIDPDADQVIVRNGPIEFESEIASLLLLGIEPILAANPDTTGSTADSFFNSTLNGTVPANANTLDHFRLNFGPGPGTGPSPLVLPVANRQLNTAPGTPWNKPHARVLMDRFTANSPATDGVDNDGDGAMDEEDEQVLAGRLNINAAERELLRDALPFADPIARNLISQAIDSERTNDDPTLMGVPSPGVLSAWDLTYRNTAPLMPNAATVPGDNSDDGQSRIDFVGNDGDDGVSGSDGVIDDVEERFLFGGATQQVTTTRSDVYVAYILIQGYRDADGDGSFETDGEADDGLIEQSRSIVLFDRSKLVTSGDEVESRVLFEFPQ